MKPYPGLCFQTGYFLVYIQYLPPDPTDDYCGITAWLGVMMGGGGRRVALRTTGWNSEKAPEQGQRSTQTPSILGVPAVRFFPGCSWFFWQTTQTGENAEMRKQLNMIQGQLWVSPIRILELQVSPLKLLLATWIPRTAIVWFGFYLHVVKWCFFIQKRLFFVSQTDFFWRKCHIWLFCAGFSRVRICLVHCVFLFFYPRCSSEKGRLPTFCGFKSLRSNVHSNGKCGYPLEEYPKTCTTMYLLLLMVQKIRLTTWDVWNPINNRINYLYINWFFAGFLNHQRYVWVTS